MREPIRGKVATIINERELAFSIGERDGVKVNMKFAVMERPIEVVDPDSREVLDTIQREKLRVKVIEVRERMSIARTYRTEKVLVRAGNAGSVLGNYEAMRKQLAGISVPSDPVYQTKVQTLRASEYGANFGKLNEAESFVKRGDVVVEVSEDEEQ